MSAYCVAILCRHRHAAAMPFCDNRTAHLILAAIPAMALQSMHHQRCERLIVSETFLALLGFFGLLLSVVIKLMCLPIKSPERRRARDR